MNWGNGAYSDVDAVRREADTAEEAEGVAAGLVEGDELVEVGDFDVLVVEEDAIPLFVLGLGFGLCHC